MDKLEIGTRIRITKAPEEDYPYFSTGDYATVCAAPWGRSMWGDFDTKYKDGVWCLEDEGVELEVLDPSLTHAEYYQRYGKLTEERIRDLLAVYENALIGYEEADSPAAPELIDRVRKIDEAAAQYLESHGEGATTVLTAFSWDDTPQGGEYWCAISEQLGEN